MFVYATERCVIGRIMRAVNDSGADSVLNKVALSVRGLMFAKKANMPKSEFGTTAGEQYCQLRRSVVKTALATVRNDLFGKFRKGEASLQSGGRDSGVA